VFGVVLQMAVPDRKGTTMFPTSNIQRSLEPWTVGFSSFAFFDGKLVEWSFILPITTGFSDEQVTEAMVRNMSDFMQGLALA
jgi:hypothetical protein